MRTAEPAARTRGVCCHLEMPLEPEQARRLAGVLKVLGDATRLSMLLALRQARQPVCICDFVAVYNLSQPTISHHMGRLRAAGLVEAHRQGIWIYYRLAAGLPRVIDQLLAGCCRTAPAPQAEAMAPPPR